MRSATTLELACIDQALSISPSLLVVISEIFCQLCEKKSGNLHTHVDKFCVPQKTSYIVTKANVRAPGFFLLP
jgi:hypothetical protein